MLKTISTAPYLAALLMSNTIGLEFVNSPDGTTATTELGAPPSRRVSMGASASIRLRKLSNAAANLYDSIGNTYRDNRRPHCQDLGQEHDVGVSDNGTNPVFVHANKSMIIRRLYASKTHGRTHLASVNTKRSLAELKPSRSSSTTSAAESIKESPQRSIHNSPFQRRPMHTESKDDVIAQTEPQERGRHSLSDDIEERLTRSVQVSEDTTYGTMARDESDGPRADVRTLFTQYDAIGDCKSSAPVPISRPAEWTPTISKEEAFTSTPGTRGHARNESVCSIWTVASSPESEHAPAPNRRKPLQLQTRPPMPNFSLSAATQQAAAATLPSKQAEGETRRPAWESWDEDFRGATAIDVPYNIRDSQASLRSHLAKLRHFSGAIASLARWRETRAGDTNARDLLAQADALLAIASSEGGQTTTTTTTSATTDELVTHLLGRTGKVTLDDALLDSLIVRTEDLIQQLSRVV